MAKKSKLKTPDWIVEGYNSEKEYSKAKGIVNEKKSEKTFKLRKCPKCDGDNVEVVIGEAGMWKCKKCGHKGREFKEEELTEAEFMEYLDNKGEEVA